MKFNPSQYLTVMKSIFLFFICLAFTFKGNAQFSKPILFQGKNVQGVSRTGAGVDGGFYSVGIFDDGGGATIRDGKQEVVIPPKSDTFPYSHSTALLSYFNATHQLVWKQRINSQKGIAIWDAVSDKDGNFIICGNFTGIAIFPTLSGEPIAIQSQFISKSYNSQPLNSFVAKYSPNGVLQWVKCVKSPEHSGAMQVKTNDNREVFVRYYFHGNTFVSDKYALVNHLRLYNLDLILIKYDAKGEEKWIVGGGEFTSKDFSINENGNPVIQGIAYGNPQKSGVLFSSEADTIFLRNQDVLHHRYEVEIQKNGQFGDVIKLQPTNHNLIVSHKISSNDGSGVCIGAPQPDESRGRDFNVTWKGSAFKTQWYDFFLFGTDSSGNGTWLVSFFGKNGQYPLELKKISNGNYWVSGWFEGTMKVKDAFDQEFEFDERAQNSFLAEVTDNGKVLWIKQVTNFFGDQYTRPVLSINQISPEKVLVSGTFRCTSAYNGLNLSPDDELSYFSSKDTTIKIKFYSHVDGFITSLPIPGNLMAAVDSSKKNQAIAIHTKPNYTRASAVPKVTEVTVVKRDFLFYPNPIKGEGDLIKLEFEAFEQERIIWKIYNSSGMSIFQKSTVYQAGKQKDEIQVGGLNAGTYFLIMETSKERLSKTILVI